MKNNHYGQNHFHLVHTTHNPGTGRSLTDAYPSLHIGLRFILALLCLGLAGSKVSAQATDQATAQPAQTPAQAPAADAVLPDGTSLNWDQLNIQTVNSKRTEALLNGIWRFAPALEGAAEPPQVGWGYIRVPGSWAAGGGGRRGGGGGGRGGGGGGVALLARGTGPQWENYNGSQVEHAWYERQVSIPADWQGRGVSLRFDRLSTDAIIFVNGKECGHVSWPWGTVDITSAVTPGQTADVRVLVAAIGDTEMVGHFWQNAFIERFSYSAAQLPTRGLIGNVYLESRASEPHVTDVFVRTSTRQKNVSLDVELTGVKQAGQVHFVADMLDEKGNVEKSFNTDAAVEAKDVQTVTVSWPWADPRLWDVQQPNLYKLRLTIERRRIRRRV